MLSKDEQIIRFVFTVSAGWDMLKESDFGIREVD